MAKPKSKKQTGVFEKIIMSMPEADRNLIIDKILRFVILDKKLHTEKPVTRTRKAIVNA